MNTLGQNTPAESGEFTDTRDGQKYRTVKIGEQVWMAENLNFEVDGSWCYGKYKLNGKLIDEYIKYGKIYGRLYTWEAAKSACPAGWHLPTRKEWRELVDAAGGLSVAGNKLKADHGWYKGNSTDAYGFSALPGGSRGSDGSFGNAGNYGCWWTATECWGGRCAYHRYMGKDFDGVDEYHVKINMSDGFSVRCVRD